MNENINKSLSRFEIISVLKRLRCVVSKSSILTVVFILSMSFYACNKNKKVQIENLGNNLDSMYMMMTDSVSLLISDSGVTKYRMSAPLWYIYDREDKKEWYFPKGIKLSSLDTTEENKSYLISDTAIYHIKEDKWELIGHVEFMGQNGSHLFTPHLFWDKNKREVYSNDTTYFITKGRELRGDRFTAMDDLSSYQIFNNSGVFEYDEDDNNSDDRLKDTTALPIDTIKK